MIDLEAGDKNENPINPLEGKTIMYVVKKPFYWKTREVWTVCYESWIKTPDGKNKHYPKIIQCKGEIERQVKTFLNKDKENHAWLWKDLTKKKEHGT